MTITALPTPPQTTDPANFDSRADAWVSALQTWTTQANALTSNVNERASQASASAIVASAAETAAETAQAMAEALANYRGQWSTLSGALAIPASVEHSGAFWALLASVANVATAQPGVSASWRVITHPAGTEPDQCPRNRDLGAAAYLNISRLPPSSGAGYATGVTAGTPQTVTVTVPGIRAEDFIVGVSLSINMPASLRIAAAVSADDTVRVTYLSDSGTVTPGAHTVYIRAEKRIPEA